MSQIFSKDAVTHNEKVFTHYATKLSSKELSTYVMFADRLSTWLRSDKAYYPDARPKILDLLEVAYSTICEVAGITPWQPVCPAITLPIEKHWVAAYVLLVQSVIPYAAHFVEPNDRDRLHRITSTISIPLATPLAIPMAQPSSSSIPEPLGHLLPLSSSQAYQISSSRTNNLIDTPTFVPPFGITPQSSRSSGQVPPVASTSLSSTQTIQHAPGVSSIPTVPENSAPKRRPKKKKRDLGNYEDFLMADLAWYREREEAKLSSKVKSPTSSPHDHTMGVTEGTSSSTVPTAPTQLEGCSPLPSSIPTDPKEPADLPDSSTRAETISSACPSSPSGHVVNTHLSVPLNMATSADDDQSLQVDLASSSIRSEIGSEVTLSSLSFTPARDVSLETSIPPSIPSETILNAPNLPSCPPVDPPVRVEDKSFFPTIQPCSLVQPETTPDIQAVSPPVPPDPRSNARVISSDSNSTSPTPPKTAQDGCPPSIPPLETSSVEAPPLRLPQTPSIQQETISTAPAPSSPLRLEHPANPAKTFPAPLPAPTMQESIGSIGIVQSQIGIDNETSLDEPADNSKGPRSMSTSDGFSGHLVRPDTSHSSPLVAPIAPAKIILSHLGSGSTLPQLQSGSAAIDEASDPDSTKSKEDQSVGESSPTPLALVDESGTSVFGPEMVIVALQRGLPTQGTITISFLIDALQYDLISKWKSGAETEIDVSDALCLSLACYPSSAFRTALARGTGERTVAEIASGHSVWPRSGGLSLQAKYNQKRHYFPLAPPIFVTPNNFMDVSEFLEVGENVISIRQHRDMSGCVYALHAHFPTAAQLKGLEQRRQVNRDWRAWLKTAARPCERTPLPWHVYGG